MPNIPGTRLRFQDADDTINAVESDSPTCILGPLYHVVDKGSDSDTFDPLTATNQAFSWPEKKDDGVVDLSGTRNGLIDSQRSVYATMPPKVFLKDGSTIVEVDPQYIENVDQDGFELKQAARTSLDRGDFDVYVLNVNNDSFIYSPSETFSVVRAGDRVVIGAANLTVSSVQNRRIDVTESLATSVSTLNRVQQDESSSDTLSITPSATAGRIVATITGNTFDVALPAVAVGDLAIVYKQVVGLTALRGSLNVTDDGVTGLTLPSTFSLDDIENYVMRVVEYSTDDDSFGAIVQTHFVKVAGYDSVAGTIDFDAAISGSLAAADAEITVLEGIIGVVESFNAGFTTMTVTVPQTFSDSLSVIDVALATSTMTVYPEFEVLASYRELRTSIVDSASSVSSLADFLAEVGHASVDYRDGLGWAMQAAFLAQGTNNVPVHYVPVDIEPDGDTGLPENRDLVLGYTNALEPIESIEVYNIVFLDQTASLDALLKTHIDAMSTVEEGLYRRGYFTGEYVLFDTESQSGSVYPGRVPGGVAALATDGNTVIYDDSVLFVTEAGIVDGTIVQVLSPPALAGTYTASGDTTDDSLVLKGSPWTLSKEFALDEVDVNTGSPMVHTISGVPAGSFSHVEAGDYVEVTESATIYRLRVESVNAAGTSMTCSDDGAGADFGTGNTDNGTDFSVIRSWNPDTSCPVRYGIKPLTRAQQVSRTIASKILVGERYSVLLDQKPTMVLYVDESGNDVSGLADSSINRVVVACQRSGVESYNDVTGAPVGGGVLSVEYGYDYLKKSHKKSLSDAGFVMLMQVSKTGRPYILDMITSSGSSDGLVKQEEMVIANADWIGNTLQNTLGTPPGSTPPNIDDKLLGVRTMQVSSLLKSWIGTRLNGYRILEVARNATNRRQTDIKLLLVLPVAEKEIEIIIQRTV